MVSIHHDQKDGSEFSDVTLASEDDNDNLDVIVLNKLENLVKEKICKMFCSVSNTNQYVNTL